MRGVAGRVYKCRHVTTGKISAVKELGGGVSAVELFEQEIENLATLAHSAILGLIGYVTPKRGYNAQIVTEWMPNGSLDGLIAKKAVYGSLTDDQKMKMVVGICRGCDMCMLVAGCIVT
jgi:serine/threonine protein kinase